MPRWTSEARAKQAELIKNWTPWKKSTGPRTDDGKAIASQNSLKTGWHTAEMRQSRQFLTRLERSRRSLIERWLEL
ncbi:MAG: hypothetical protein KME12_23580 [Trichocoleus desertorum ATA4-8-CV12]|nr:hypothetical protein [Trichocoleus desertorum ATA4-8-CV12]